MTATPPATARASRDDRARDLLHTAQAWPLAHRLRQQALAMVLPPQPRPVDRLTPWLAQRRAWTETYARPVRVKRDADLPTGLADAVQHDVMPQFALRNIGRVERDNHPEDPLPLTPVPGLGGRPGAELAEVRDARVPSPQFAEIWSVRLMGRVRASLRRIVREDPWALRLGPEATSGYDGRPQTFIVEGTHPHDLPDAWWGPETTRPPERPQGPPPQPGDAVHAGGIFAQMREITR